MDKQFYLPRCLRNTRKIFSATASVLLLGLGFGHHASAGVVTVEVGTFFAPELGLGQSAEGTQKIAITYSGTGPALSGLRFDFAGTGVELDNDPSAGDPDGSGSNDNDPAFFTEDITALTGPPFFNDTVGTDFDPVVPGPWQTFFVGFFDSSFNSLGFDTGDSVVMRADLDPAGGTGFGNPTTDDPPLNSGNDYSGASVTASFFDGTEATALFDAFYPTTDCVVTQVWCAFATIGTPIIDEVGAIVGNKWNDSNGDGIQDGNEPGLEGWDMSLLFDGELFDTTTTDADGNYAFLNLAAGEYLVEELLQPNWIQTFNGGANLFVEVGSEIIANFGNQFVEPPGGSVPEPATLALLGLGLAGLGFARKRQH